MMQLIVDNLTSVTGWSASGGTTSIWGTNSIEGFIAGNNSSSLILYFNGLNSYCQKTLGTDVTNYNQIILHVWSREKTKQIYNTASDFSYKIDFGSGKEFYMPISETFSHFVIDISDINTLDRIRITSNHSDDDYLIISYLVVCDDEFPLDIFSSVKTQIEYIRDLYGYDESYLLSTASGSSGSNSITFSIDVSWIQRYAVIKIDDGINSEIHQIEKKEGKTFYFNELYDGKTLQNTYSNANVYLYFPVEFGVDDTEIILPGITVWGIVPEKLKLNNELDYIVDTYNTDDTFKERKEGQYLKYTLIVDCESRQQEILAVLSRIVKTFLGQQTVWVNGRKIHIDYDGVANEIQQTQPFNIIPKIQYSMKIEVKEEIWTRNILYRFDTLTHNIYIQ